MAQSYSSFSSTTPIASVMSPQERDEAKARDVAMIEMIKKHPEYPHVFDIDGKDPNDFETGYFTSQAGTTPVNIAYTVYGNGPNKVVLIPGFQSVQSAWTRFIRDALKEPGQYTVLTYDNRGTGKSSRYSNFEKDCSIKVMAQDLLGLIDHLGWNTVRGINGIGWFVGTMILQEVAILQPRMFNTYTSVSGALQINHPITSFSEFEKRFVPVTSREKPTWKENLLELFSNQWLSSADDMDDYVSSPFESNLHRAVAQAMKKRDDLKDQKGEYAPLPNELMYHLFPVVRRTVDPQAVLKMHIEIGKGRSMIVHGSEDKAFDPNHYFNYLEAIQFYQKSVPSLGWEATVETQAPWSNYQYNADGHYSSRAINPRFFYGSGNMTIVENREAFFDHFESALAMALKENVSEKDVGEKIAYDIIPADQLHEGGDDNACLPIPEDWKDHVPSWIAKHF